MLALRTLSAAASRCLCGTARELRGDRRIVYTTLRSGKQPWEPLTEMSRIDRTAVGICLQIRDRCASFRLRKIERAVTRHYETYLASAGVTATQFSLLACIGANGRINPRRLSELLELDRSTLSRNLSLLSKGRLLRIERGRGPKPDTIALSARGEQTLTRAVEAWQQAHDVLEELASPGRIEDALQSLSRLAYTIRSEELRTRSG